jgi:hypothetical protein
MLGTKIAPFDENRPVMELVADPDSLSPVSNFQLEMDAEARKQRLRENLKAARMQRTRDRLEANANKRAWLAVAAESAGDPAIYEGLLETTAAERRMYTPEVKRREGFVKQVNLSESSGAKAQGVPFEQWQAARQKEQAEAMIPEGQTFETPTFSPVRQGTDGAPPVLRQLLLDEAYEDRKQQNGPTVRAANSLYLAEATGMEIKEASAVYDSLVRHFFGDKEPADIRPLSKLVRRWYSDHALTEQGIDPAIYRAAKAYAVGDEEIDWDTVLANIPAEKADLFNDYVQQLTQPKQRGFLAKVGETLKRSGARSIGNIAAHTVLTDSENSNVTTQVKNSLYEQFRSDNGREPFGIEVFEINERAKQQAVRQTMTARGAKQAKEAADPVKGENVASRMTLATLGIAPDMLASMAAGAATGTGPVGTGYYWYVQTAGGIYEDMIDYGFDDETAQTTAKLTALPIAAINALQVGQLAGIAKRTQAQAAQAAGVSLSRYIAKRTGQYGVDVLKEYGEEWLESGFEVAGKAAAAILAEEAPEIDWYEQVIQPELEGLKEAAWGFPLLVGGAHGVNVAKEAKFIRKMTRGGMPADIARGIVVNPEAFRAAAESYRPVQVEGLAEAEAANQAARTAENPPAAQEGAGTPTTPQDAAGSEQSSVISQQETSPQRGIQSGQARPLSGVERNALIGETVQRWNAAQQQFGADHELTEYLSRRIGILRRGGDVEALANLAMEYGIDETDFSDPSTQQTNETASQTIFPESGKRADQAKIDEVVAVANDILSRNGVTAEVRAVDKTVQSDEMLEQTGTRPTGATIFEGDGKAVIELAFAVNEKGQTADVETAAHESWHVLRAELDSDTAAVLDEAFGGDLEAEARAFGQYYRARQANEAVEMGAIEKALQKILDLLKRIVGDFKKQGYRSAEAIFEAAATGKLQESEVRSQKTENFSSPSSEGAVSETTPVFELKPVEITGDELGEFRTVPELRKKARQYAYEKVAGNYTVESTGEQVTVSKQGIKHGTSTQNIDKIKSIVAVGQLIENSRKTGVETDKRSRSDIKAVHKYAAAIKAGEQVKPIEIVVRETKNGRFYYDHYIEKKPAGLPQASDEQLGYEPAAGLSNNTIAKEGQKFKEKPEPGKNVQFELKDGGKTREDEKFEAEAEEAVAGAMAGSDPGRVKAFLDDLDKQAEALTVPEFAEDVRDATKAAWAVFTANNATTNDLSLAAVVEAAGKLGKYQSYEQSAKPSKNWVGRRMEGLKDLWNQSGREFVKDLVPMTTRLLKVSPTVFRKVRTYQMDVLMRTAAMQKQVAPFLEGVYKLRKTNTVEYRQLWRAMLNGETGIRDRLLAKYGLTEHFKPVQAVFDTLFKTANAVGMEIPYRTDYWPRLIVRMDAFLEFMYGKNADMRSFIEEALKKTVAARGGRELTEEERWRYVNSLLRGFRVGGLTLSRSGHALERRIEFVDETTQDFYGGLEESLMDYIVEMNTKITQREFFARETVEMVNLRAEKGRLLTRLNKLSGKEAGKVFTIREGWKQLEGEAFKEHLSQVTKQLEAVNAKIKELDTGVLEQSVGRYVADAVANFKLHKGEQITPRAESELRNMLNSIMDPRGYHGKLMKLFVGATYGTTLGSPTNAITQLKELALAYYRSTGAAIPETVKAIFGKSEITPADIGIESVGDEFSADNMNRIVRKILKVTGFTLTDGLGKTTYINTVLRKYRADAGKLTDADAAAMAEGTKAKNEFYERIEKVFGDRTAEVIGTLRSGGIDWDVKLLLFNELSDIQPVSVAEMPERYARGGNMRVFYMLKSFTVRQLDFARREIFDDLRHKGTALRGLRRAAKLVFMLEVFGASSDLIKAIMTGREFDPEESLIDNLLQYAFMSQYTLNRMNREGWAQGWMQGWIPPMKTINDLTDAGEGDWVRSVPVGGELYYWWFGAGANK